MTDSQIHATEIVDQFLDRLNVSADKVEERLGSLATEYRIPTDKARWSVVSGYLDEAGIGRDEFAGGSGGGEQTLFNDIDEDGQWIDVHTKIIEFWEPRSKSITQVGLLGGDSRRMKSVSFTMSGLPELEEGKSYALGSVTTDEYQDNFSAKLDRTTSITKLDEGIEVGDDSASVEGAFVDSQSRSDLIKRCPEEGCTRVLQNGRCSEHGGVKGGFDPRIKAAVDNGDEVHEVILNREVTEELTGIELDETKQIAMDVLGTTTIEEEIRGDPVGYCYRVTGPTLGRYVLTNEVERLCESADAEELSIRARSM